MIEVNRALINLHYQNNFIHLFIIFFHSKSNAHDEEVRRLYEEMEQQIKAEKDRILKEVSKGVMSRSSRNPYLGVI